MKTDTTGIPITGRFDIHLGYHVLDFVVVNCDIDIDKIEAFHNENEARCWAAKKLRAKGIPVTSEGYLKAGELRWLDLNDMNVRRFVWHGLRQEMRDAHA